MKKLAVILLALLLCGCAAPQTVCPETSIPVTTVPETTAPETTVPETTIPETTVPETTVPETTIPETMAAAPSPFLLEGCTLEDLLTYWDEVVLQMEYTDGTGDASVVQKWLGPIRCRVYGSPTDEDLEVLEALFSQLNGIDGFPGIHLAAEDELENLTLSFQEPDRFTAEFSDAVNGEDAWGATQFWYYTDTNELHDGRIGIRTDIPQSDRSSIILEEVINTLGISDSELRPDSIVYQYSNENLALSDVDLLLLKLLYDPAIRPGMDKEEPHSVLGELYQ